MNIFGAFTFGSLIKTFLPGFVWTISLGIFEIGAAVALSSDSFVLALVKAQPQLTMVLMIPASILFGLLSNVAIFMGINDLLIREPFKTAHKELHDFYMALGQRARTGYWKHLEIEGGIDSDSYENHADVEIFLVEKLGVEKVSYVREQYWYFMEFQMNLGFSLIALVAAMTLYLIAAPAVPAQDWVKYSGAILIMLGICRFLLIAARKNYVRHMAKMASLLVAFLQPTGDTATGDGV